METLSRRLDLPSLLAKKSHFLLGPRGTGKTSLIRSQFNPGEVFTINLLESDTHLRLLTRPEEIRAILKPVKDGSQVVVDEIQKIPELLDEVHHLIESRRMRFLLTGSSARKLRLQGVNLLGGRARMAHLFPLSASEIPGFDLDRFLLVGGLPGVHLGDEPFEDLIAYVDQYIREEVQQEAQVRNLAGFARFLLGAALQNGQLLNYAAVASDAMVAQSTVREYYQILGDTLLGETLEPWKASRKRKAIQTAKFYLFDTGVTNAILRRQAVPRHSDTYGNLFEQWVFMELRAYLAYRRLHEPLTYWRSTSKQEVDFLLGEKVAIEVKAKDRVSERDLAGLLALKEEKVFKRYLLVSNDPVPAKREGVECLPWSEFVARLWGGDLL